MTAIRRVEAFCGSPVPLDGDERVRVGWHGYEITVADLRAVLALAKQAAELKRRVRLANRHVLTRYAPRSCGVGAWLAKLYDLLDLRKPLPKRKRHTSRGA